MGLDIYAGTMTRYYSQNWKSTVQQWGEEHGMQVNIVRPEEQNAELATPEEILEGVTGWRDRLIAALSDDLSEKSTPSMTRSRWLSLHFLYSGKR
ncbi:MAG: hypothetical protein IJ740_08695 [Ruminococcus sp.]|nr:hypothetical protein [Ruminococcus sp.]